MTDEFDKTLFTPKLDQVIDTFIESALCDLHTSLPAEVISYDYSKNTATVKPSLKRKYKNQELAEDLPIISGVPVSFQRMGPAHLRLPVNPGDTGQLIFCERSIDGWVQSGGSIDPLDPRKHDLSDAVFYPGLNPLNNPIDSQAAQDSIELKLNGAYLEITSDGKFKIKNDSEELFDLMDQFLEILKIATTALGIPLSGDTIAQLEQLRLKFESLKGD